MATYSITVPVRTCSFGMTVAQFRIYGRLRAGEPMRLRTHTNATFNALHRKGFIGPELDGFWETRPLGDRVHANKGRPLPRQELS